MMIVQLHEWIFNFLALGLGVFFLGCGIFVIALLFSVIITPKGDKLWVY